MSERTVKVNLVAHATGYVAGMDVAAKKTREVGSEAEKLAQKAKGFERLGKAGVAVGVAVLGIGAAALATGIQYNTLQQTTRAALTTLLGSAKAANEQMDKLDAFARNSPFAKQVFIQAQQQMLGFGVAAKDVIPALGSIQDAVAAMGGGNQQIASIAEIMARIKSESRLSGDALQRLGYYGIDAAQIIGSQMGKTAAEIRDMAGKPGGIPVEQIWDPLVNGMTEKFGGAAANVKKTFEGSMDRVKAAWRDFSSELARPLVDPNGGGALIDLLNWAADVMRWFLALPEPVRATTSSVLGVVGAVALLGGTTLLAIPKIAHLRAELAAVGVTGASMGAKLKGVASFLFGPWGLAIAAAVVGVQLLAEHLNSLQASNEEVEASFKGAKTAADVFMTAAKGKDAKFWLVWADDIKTQLKDLPNVLQAAADQSENLFARFDSTHFGAFDALKTMGATLADMSKTSFPDAQEGFRLIAKETDGSRKELWRLLSMMPAYRDAVEQQALEWGLLNAETSEAERKSILLEVAQRTGAGAVDEKTAAIERQIAAEEEAIKKAEEWREEMHKQDAAFIDLGGAYDTVIQKNKDVAQSTADATKSSKDSWEDYYDGVTVAIGDFIAELQKQVDAQNNWESNMILLSGRVSSGMLDELAKLGPEGAALVASLASATDAELAKIEPLWAERAAAATGAFVLKLEDSKALVDIAAAQLGDGAAKEIAAKLAAGTSTVEEIIEEYKLKIASTNPEVLVDTSNAQAKLNELISSANRFANSGMSITAYVREVGGRAEGGAIQGPGGPRDDTAGLFRLSNGEHVLTAADVARMGGQSGVYAFRESLYKGLAGGGQASYSAPTHVAAPYSGFGGGSSVGSPSVSLAGAVLVAEMDGVPFRLMIRDQIVSNERQQLGRAFAAKGGGH